MPRFARTALAGAVSLAVAQAATAGTGTYFIPLTKAETVEPADSVDERNAPWSVPYGVTFKNLTNMEKIENEVTQSIVRVPAGNTSSMFDMLAYDPTGRYIFIPHETPIGAGLSRYDTETDVSEILFKGDESGDPGFVGNTDFAAFDPARWTPNGTVILGEEWAGTGRLVEFCDPLGPAPTDPVAGGSELVEGNCEKDPNADWRVLDGIPLVSWEGIQFSLNHPDRVIYYVDENNSGSIYKTVFKRRNEYNVGRTYVLKVKGFKGNADENYDSDTNASQPRVGLADWVAITDKNGNPLPGVQDPREVLINDDGSLAGPGVAGRLAADDVGGTPYGRPEDMTQSTLRGKWGKKDEAYYFTATSENAIYVIQETAWGPYVKLVANGDTPTNLGFEPTTAALNSPDNLAIDALGNLYVIEDAPNTTTVGADGGDIWFVRDVDGDGVAESLDHFLALQVNQSEHTGMIFHPVDPTRFVVAVQHPASTALGDSDNDGIRDSDGFGDAVWEFDLSGVIAPECGKRGKDWVTFNHKTHRPVVSCAKYQFYNWVEQLEDSEKPNDFPLP